MIQCDGIDIKKGSKCNSPAKYIVNIDEKKYYRCGRHSRNINDKELIENTTDDVVKEKKKRGRKVLKNDENKELNIEKEDSNLQEKLSYQNENINNNLNNEKNKMEILFAKIDELCKLLNNNTID